jgi:type IV pilus assembly protein PilQ
MSVKGRSPFLFEAGQPCVSRQLAVPSRKVLEVSKLVFAASLFVGVLGGCSARKQPELSSATTASESVIAGNEESSNEAISTNTAPTETTETLVTGDAGNVGIEQIKTANSVTYLLKTASAVTTVDSFPISKPARLVVDLKGVTTKTAASLPISTDPAVQAIRVGGKSGSTRVVFDLASSTPENLPTVEKLADGSGVAVTFGAPALETATVAQNTIEQNTVELAETPVLRETGLGQTELTALNFEKSPNSAGKVTVNLQGQPNYSLKQSGPTEYVLTLKNSTAQEEAMKPLIAQPGKVTGLRVVRAAQKGSDIEVRMFVDAGTDLKATKTGAGLAIVASNAINANQPDARAQLSVDPAAKEAAKPDTTEGAKVVETSDDTARRNPTGISSQDGYKNYTGRLISLDLQETDIDNALRIIAEVSNLNIIASDDVTGKVTLRLIDVPWDQALDVILKTNGLDQVTEGNVIRIAPVDKLRQEREALREAKKAAENLEDLKVKYIRVSYARATDLKEQVETVLSERGSATVDERTNQLIIKDIQKGQEEILQLVKKLDLRTPQVLLETQIVEASRSLLRDLGFQWNFSYSMSPQTGNPTGLNFPNSVVVGGGASSASGLQAVNFPAAIAQDSGSAIAAILDSADGSRALSMRLTALEREGKVRVLSRPQVATVNNKEAEIKSVETVRIPLPDSGLAVATGQGANAAGGGASAFQTFDVGITLRVTPQASPDYFVLLDVYANSSTFGERIVQNIPSTLERQTTSTILVKSGQTFALGGVYRINDRDQVDGLPFFKDIPVLGTFFRRTLVDKRDEELIFFITPHIVEGSFDPSLM